MEELTQEELTQEELIKIEENFIETTTNIVKAADGYNKENSVAYEIFMDSVQTYLGIYRYLQENPENDFTNHAVKIKIFENLFNFNFDDEITKVLNNKMMDTEGTNDEDINNADTELLKNIKNNIQQYLK